MDTNSELPATRGRAFTRESLERGENRINFALFYALAIPEFRLPFCRLLGLSDDARFKREVIPSTQLRPDFLFEDGESEGCIEVELGGPDIRQNRRYLAELDRRTICLVGPAVNSNGSPSLERVAELARNAAAKKSLATNWQATEVLRNLAQLIEDHVRPDRRRPSPQEIPLRLRLPWFERAIAPLIDLEKQGFVENRPIDNHSLSLRLKHGPSIRCADSFALITQRGTQYFEVPTPTEMDRIFREPLKGIVSLWEALLDRASPCWRAHVDGRKRVRIDARTIETHADEFADVYARLRDCLIPSGAQESLRKIVEHRSEAPKDSAPPDIPSSSRTDREESET